MSSWLKGLALGIAALLGLSRVSGPPAASMRAFRDADTLYASLELYELPDADLVRLVESSFTLRVSAQAWAGQSRGQAYRDIRFDGRYYVVRISESGGTHKTADAAAAWAMVSRFGLIPLGALSELRFPLAIGCKVILSLPDYPEYDPMVVWGYRAAAAYMELDAPGMAPYY